MGRSWAAVAAASLALLPLACSDSSPSAAVTTTTSTTTTTTTAMTTTTTTSTTAAPAVTGADVQAVIDEFAAAQDASFSIVVVDLTSGLRAEHDAGRQVLSASLYKLFVARELLRRIYAGELSRDAGAGDGQGRTVGECLEAMIVVSDDACGVAGLSIVGRGALDDDLAADGFTSTRLARPQRTSAADVALFLEQARAGTLLGPGGEAASAELYGLLQRQEVNDRLPAELPPGTPVAHKTGDRTYWAHDAGIVTTPQGDILVVALSGPWPAPCCHEETPGPLEHEAFGSIAHLGAALYALWQ